MDSTMMMYILPMMLGQTYDMGKDKPGLQIFPSNVNKSARVVEQYITDSQYRLVENSADIKDFLDVKGKLSLKIKSGMIDASGEGSYLKKASTFDNTLEILIKIHFETITMSIPSYEKPVQDWAQMNREHMGTHYMRSMTYGGDLIASIKIKYDNKYDMERMKGALNVGASAKGGAFEGEMAAKLEKLTKDGQDSSSMEISYYATVPLEGVSYTLDGLLELVKTFPEQVKKVNNGRGNPLRMEMYPLSSLDANMKDYVENRALGEKLEEMDYEFDDILLTRKEIAKWVSGLPPAIPKDANTKIEQFTEKLNNLNAIFFKSIEQLDTSKNASTDPITRALKAYKDGDMSMPQKYLRKFRSLQQEIYKNHPGLRPRIGGAYFNHWGRSKCESSETETVFSGVMSSSQSGQNGGSSNFVCSPFNPENPDPKEYFPEYDPDDEDQRMDNLLVSPIKYTGELRKFKEMNHKQVACATCRSAHRTVVLVKPGDSQCPGKWTKEYDGFLMAPGIDDPKAEYVCVDAHMQQVKGNITFGTDEGTHIFKIQEVSVMCGGLPCGPYQADKPIPCVVCTV